MRAKRCWSDLQFVFGMLSVIQARMVLHDISTRCVCGGADNRAANTFSINLFLAEDLYMGPWFQCFVGIFEHDFAPPSL